MTGNRLSRPGSRSDCEVLIVGAGPTGLVLACELLARGVGVRLIDKSGGVAGQTRALAVHARALEVLDMMGLAGAFIEHGQVVRRFGMYADGRDLVRVDLARNGSRFGFMLDIPQDLTETILRHRVCELGGRIEQGAELGSLRQDADRVTATVAGRTGTARTITASYLVGADGAHSQVRSQLTLAFRGHPYPEDWLLADVHLDWDRPGDEVHAFFRRDGRPLICMPMRDQRWRVIIPHAGDRGQQAPTLEEIQQLVTERAPAPAPQASGPTWLATFRCHRRSAGSYRRGRVLLAGDAVHIHSPAGGQGMNTGILDAHNLAWKLALVASGHAPGRLLDSYGQERGPAAADVLALTHALVTLGTMTHPAQRALRKTVIPLASRLAPVQRRAARRMGQLHVSYPSSPLTAPGRAGPGIRPGQRAPDLAVTGSRGQTRLHEVLRRGRHVLLITGADGDGQVPLGPWQDHVEIVSAPNGHASRAGGRVYAAPGAYLLRPDGYLAARGPAASPQDLLDHLHRTFGTTGQPA
jgi:2-polyprenyl-6-methoxyphenol hydroxylase-like FAD-dependent oxidoreductase